MPNYDALQTRKNQLIRKALGGSLFVAPATADPITALTGPDSLLKVLPDGYTDGGYLTDDGMSFGRDVEQSEVSSFGAYEPTRTDITSDIDSVEVTFQETNKQTIAMFTGAALEALVPDPETGELSISKPARPTPRHYRVLALAVDLVEEGEIYIARFLPRAKQTDYSEQAYAKGDDPITWGMTLRGERDSALGYAGRYIFGGPGWKALLADMGFATTGS